MSIISLFSIGALVLSALLIPLIIKFCNLYSLYDTVNARKIHSGNIPRLGGIAIGVSFLVCCVLCFAFNRNLAFRQAFPLLIAGLIIFVFGVIDDIFEMRAILKLLVQLVATAIIVLNGFSFSRFFGLAIPTPIGMVLTYFWIVGIINAYNLIDGMDGLCGTLSCTSIATIGILLYPTFKEASVICFVLTGSIIGFLLFNWPRPNAKIFMGDNGSQFLGFMIATIPLCPSNYPNFEYNKFLIMLVLVSFPMLDTLAAIARRIREHRPIMSPDKSHLHHKLLNLGYTKSNALKMILAVQLLICVTVILALYLGDSFSSHSKSIILLVVSYFFMFGFFVVIHYTNRFVNQKINREGLNK